MDLETRLDGILRQAPGRLDAFWALREINLPGGAIGAGYIRAAVWDHLTARPPSDVDDIDVL